MAQETALCIAGGRGLLARQPMGSPKRMAPRRWTLVGVGRGTRVQIAETENAGKAVKGGKAVKAVKATGGTNPVKATAAPKQGKVSIIIDKTLDVVNTKAGPLLWSAGLVVLGAAVAHTVHRLLKLRLENERSSSSQGASTSLVSSRSDVTSDHSILFSELEAKLMSPLLLAAETSAEVDETSTMSVAELGDLEVTLRTLLTGMDAQLEELKYQVLEQGLIPDHVLDAIDAGRIDGEGDAVELVDDADGDAWREFKLFEMYVGDQERRSFRSLLYNRSVQVKLLHQVERQIKAKRQTGSENAIGGDAAREPTSRPGDSLASLEGDRGHVFYAAGATAPHVLKKTKGGEDAFFVDNVAMVMGIADGVGACL